MTDYFALMRPLIHALPPEVAHRMGIRLLREGWWPAGRVSSPPSLAVSAFGLSFPNPVGMAAGFDKNAEAMDALLTLGFGFVEAGTVTPRSQPGNPCPRVFRLREDEALINRLGFNNEGLAPFSQRFARRDKTRGIAGANIGKNKDTVHAVADYVAGLQAVYALADYVTVNISSPNTQGLRDLQQREALSELLQALKDARAQCAASSNRQVPLLLKVAPDLDMPAMHDIAEAVLAHGVDGLIVSNTTIARPPGLRSPHRAEQGGLSGKPLMQPSTECLRQFYKLLGGRIPLVGVGGIASADDAYAKIRAGATLVQLYTAITYQGFGMVPRLLSGLDALLKRDGLSHIQQAVGLDT